MAIGDNFDTTPPGFTNQTTLRKSGHGRISQYPGHYSDDNKGHPCNAGCGCKTACHEGTIYDTDARCQLPPELTINVTTASSRGSARSQISAAPEKKVHLVYSNGAWRGRRCCEFDSDDNELCDPCDVTTDKDGNKTDCSYSGQEGTTRSRPPGGPRRPNPDSPRQLDPDRTNCWQDGDIPEPLRFCASYTDASFKNLYGQIGLEKCSGGFCIDGSGAVTGINIYKDAALVDDNNAGTTGTYVGMENTATKVQLEFHTGASAAEEFWNGRLALVAIVAKELSADEEWQLNKLVYGFYDLTL